MKACPADLAAGECRGLALNGHEIAVYHVDGRWYATGNICTHQEALLTDGYLDGGFIECPLHQGRFNIVSGEVEGPPVTEPLPVYPIKVDDEGIWIDVEV